MKPKVIIIYGAMGVGKLTIAKLLSEKTDYRLSHNHLVNDLLYSLFERNTLEINELAESIRDMVYEKAIQSGKSFIITHTYSHDYVSLTGQTDPGYLQKLQEKIKQAGGEAYFIHLQANNTVLLERVTQESRKEFKKLTDSTIMQELIDTKDFKTSAEVDNQLILDSSELNPEETVMEVFNFIPNN
jgi:shikimate kinase